LKTFDKSLFDKPDNYQTDLVECYINGDKEKFIKVFKDSNIRNEKEIRWREWFIFKRWMSDLE